MPSDLDTANKRSRWLIYLGGWLALEIAAEALMGLADSQRVAPAATQSVGSDGDDTLNAAPVLRTIGTKTFVLRQERFCIVIVQIVWQANAT